MTAPGTAGTDVARIDAIADRFAAAIAGGDMATLDRLFTPDFQVWYNFTDATLDRAQALAFFGSYFTSVQVHFRDVRRLPTPAGWVQQHRVDAAGPDGFRLSGLPALIVFTLDGDRISRIEEYIDSAQTPGFDASRMAPG
ncbi:nuclear transport factor 2 family protein [Novosphingobium lentum]|uniref:nuclear transport factor 2 family protein n=1 Tax=Novosphingobium lentum TaxID=145287 RepID=UPI00082EDFDB|nr:nuclear transport factor 2 family protein [Novosphingobium lentum]